LFDTIQHKLSIERKANVRTSAELIFFYTVFGDDI